MSPRQRFQLRMGLLTRIAVSLVSVGLLPLAAGILPTLGMNQEAMDDQVKRTHSVAARATSVRLEAHVEGRQKLARALAANRLLYASPKGESGQEILRATLQAEARLAGIALHSSGGEEIIRGQRLALSDAVSALLTLPGGDAVTASLRDGDLWIRYTTPLPEGSGTLHLVENASYLAELFRPEDLGREAHLTLLGSDAVPLIDSGSVSGPRSTAGELPTSLVEAASSGGLHGAGRFRLSSGREVLGAFDPVAGTPWNVISSQPTEIADEIARRAQRTALAAITVALGLSGLLISLAYSSVVRPIRGMLAAQRQLAGSAVRPEVDDEIEALKVSFEGLHRRAKDREELGRVFLGRYQVVEVCGEGAMGTVFRGWDPKLQRPVALKTVRLEGAPSAVERGRLVSGLLQEAIATAQLSHPHIVAVFDVEDSAEAAFIAMEFVEGVSLEQLLWQRKRLTPGEAVPMGAAVARGLAAAHQRGLAHRDIKPGNILLGHDGTIKIADFGLAAFLSSLATGSGQIFGTPGYAAPEVVLGEPADARGDLFSLGVVLYQALSGGNPFFGDAIEDTLTNTVRGTVQPLRASTSDIPGQLDSLIGQMLDKTPARRPTDAGVIVESLEALALYNGWRWSLPECRAPMGPAAVNSARSTAQWVHTLGGIERR